MTGNTQERRDPSFVTGLLTGAFVGAGLAIWLVPRVVSLSQQVTRAAREFGHRASTRYEDVSTQIGAAVDDLTKKGQGVRDDMADAIARGAHEVERVATAAKTVPTVARRQHAAADLPAPEPRSL